MAAAAGLVILGLAGGCISDLLPIDPVGEPEIPTRMQGPLPSPADEAAPRELHPQGPGDAHCVEMVSTCRDDGECTSAPLTLACDEVAALPDGERVRCACP